MAPISSSGGTEVHYTGVANGRLCIGVPDGNALTMWYQTASSGGTAFKFAGTLKVMGSIWD